MCASDVGNFLESTPLAGALDSSPRFLAWVATSLQRLLPRTHHRRGKLTAFVFCLSGSLNMRLRMRQIQTLITSANFAWGHLLRLLGTEVLRVLAEHALDTFA